jgi:hypothetical protein
LFARPESLIVAILVALLSSRGRDSIFALLPENIVSAVRINNQLVVNVINAVAENVRTFNRSTESMMEFNTKAAKAWNSFLTAQRG